LTLALLRRVGTGRAPGARPSRAKKPTLGAIEPASRGQEQQMRIEGLLTFQVQTGLFLQSCRLFPAQTLLEKKIQALLDPPFLEHNYTPKARLERKIHRLFENFVFGVTGSAG
jgi:hypothetical protein